MKGDNWHRFRLGMANPIITPDPEPTDTRGWLLPEELVVVAGAPSPLAYEIRQAFYNPELGEPWGDNEP